MTKSANSEDFSTTGVPASSLGMVLQRGGEELILEKVSDRDFTRELSPLLDVGKLNSWELTLGI